jgi:hypothetical protein
LLEFIEGLVTRFGALQNPARHERAGADRAKGKMAANVIKHCAQRENRFAVKLSHDRLQKNILEPCFLLFCSVADRIRKNSAREAALRIWFVIDGGGRAA